MKLPLLSPMPEITGDVRPDLDYVDINQGPGSSRKRLDSFVKKAETSRFLLSAKLGASDRRTAEAAALPTASIRYQGSTQSQTEVAKTGTGERDGCFRILPREPFAPARVSDISHIRPTQYFEIR